MNNKRLGLIIIVISILVGIIVFSYNYQLRKYREVEGCIPQTEDCIQLESWFTLSHFAIGLIFGTLSLGLYLIFFSRGEEEILKRLEEEKKNRIDEERFNIMLSMLDPIEQKVLKSIKEQNGITQQTLRIRNNISKAKLSQILTSFEKKNIIKRVKKGKTLEVHLIHRI